MSKVLNSERLSEINEDSLPVKIDGIVIGQFMGLDHSGTAQVEILGKSGKQTLSARATVSLNKTPIGKDVALMFEGGDFLKPIVIGLIQNPEKKVDSERTVAHAELDGERIVFTAEKEIVLRCGKASMTLTRAGKIILRGEYILSRSSGVNRIKGGTVQIN